MADEIEERRDVEYASHGGVSRRGNLYVPKAPGKYPVVIAVHGGGWRMSNRENYQYLAPWLAQRGFVVFAITYRISRPGEKSYPEAVQDVRAAVQFVKGRAADLRVDPERVALVGDSAGGHLSSLVALAGEHPLFRDGNKNDRFGGISTHVRAVASVYGVYDLIEQWRHDQACRSRDHITEQFLGVSLIDDRRIYFDASPLSYVSASNNNTAFLLSWGTADDIVDYRTQALPFLEALKHASHYVRTVPIEGAPHFWNAEPLDEPGSYSAHFAPKLLRFLRERV